MHIAEGVLSTPVLLGGAALTLAGTTIGLRGLDYDRLMTTAVLAAVFFVASLVHVPLGPGNVHLILNGFLGILLGWAAFPALLAALLLQAVLFQFGGLTTLGVNTAIMACPAVLCSLLFSSSLVKSAARRRFAAFCCGALSVAGAALMAALALSFSEEGFSRSAQILFVAHIPIMLVEGLLTALIVDFTARVRPEILDPRGFSEA